jgi:hypothetical protein
MPTRKPSLKLAPKPTGRPKKFVKPSKPKKPDRYANGVDQKDTSYPVCLGWCGSLRFKPKFKWDRYCTKCAAKKADLEKGMSRREEMAETAGNSLPSGFYSDV